MSAKREDENYLDFFAFKVASDVILVDWWKGYRYQFPRIAKLARKWLCVTATSPSSERVFSDCKLALTAKLKAIVLRDQVLICACYLTITDNDIQAQFLEMK
jgi:hAT family C-terminal dimerisation region